MNEMIQQLLYGVICVFVFCETRNVPSQKDNLDIRIADDVRIRHSGTGYLHHADYKMEDNFQNMKESSNMVGDSTIWQTEGNSQCPPPAEIFRSSLCSVPRCKSNDDCRNNSYVCCNNGCHFTCVWIPPPLVIDWIEESDNYLSDIHSHKPLLKKMFSVETTEKTVTLRGGCRLLPGLYHNLEIFKQNRNVKKCYCDRGIVYCKIQQHG